MQPNVMTSTTVAAAVGRRRLGAASFVKPGPAHRASAIRVNPTRPAR